jgi:hypothetical protein
MDEFIRNKLEDQKESAVTSLLEVLQTNQNIEGIAICVAYAYLDGVPSAVKLIEEANLLPIDIAAILNDTERFAELYTKELNLIIGEAQYDNRY